MLYTTKVNKGKTKKRKRVLLPKNYYYTLQEKYYEKKYYAVADFYGCNLITGRG